MPSNVECLIRLAGHQDVVDIARMIRRFYKRDGGIYGIPYDHDSCMASVSHTIDNGVAVIGPNSCAGALVVPFDYNFRFKIALVYFWYFSAPREFVVFDVLCRECARRGASVVKVASLAPKHGAKKFYARRKLTVIEAHHMGVNPQFACILEQKGAQESEMIDEPHHVGGPS